MWLDPTQSLPAFTPPTPDKIIEQTHPKLLCPVLSVAATVRRMEIDQFVFETNNTHGYLGWVGLGLETHRGARAGCLFSF